MEGFVSRPREGNESIEKWNVGSYSIASEKHPDCNEDRVYINQAAACVGVFDGLGGQEKGDVAAEIGRSAVETYLKELSASSDASGTKDALAKALKAAHEAVMDKRTETSANMSSTAALAAIRRTSDGFNVIAQHVGDSRVYVIEGGKMRGLTVDHTKSIGSFELRAYMQSRLGNIQNENDFANIVERALFNQRNEVLRHLSTTPFSSESTIAHVATPPLVLVVSDGITDNLTEHEILACLKEAHNTQAAAQRLCEAALERSREKGTRLRAKPDDMTAVLLCTGPYPSLEETTVFIPTEPVWDSEDTV